MRIMQSRQHWKSYPYPTPLGSIKQHHLAGLRLLLLHHCLLEILSRDTAYEFRREILRTYKVEQVFSPCHTNVEQVPLLFRGRPCQGEYPPHEPCHEDAPELKPLGSVGRYDMDLLGAQGALVIAE